MEILNTLVNGFVKFITIPEVSTTLVALLVAFAFKKKWVTETEYKKAKEKVVETLDAGHAIEVAMSAATDATRLKLPEVKTILADAKIEATSGDTNKKKINRLLRKTFRGILFGG